MSRVILSLLVSALMFAGALISGPALANAKLERAARLLEQQSRSGKGEFIKYLIGAASAYRWAIEGSDAASLKYCLPPTATLDGRTYARIALEEYRHQKDEYAARSEYPLDIFTLALLRGLHAKYPCSAEQINAASHAGSEAQ